ncbi:MAG: hypothetical protein ACI8RA_002756 [Chlamydiales bacterium]|jgi:hypothetical protein
MCIDPSLLSIRTRDFVSEVARSPEVRTALTGIFDKFREHQRNAFDALSIMRGHGEIAYDISAKGFDCSASPWARNAHMRWYPTEGSAEKQYNFEEFVKHDIAKWDIDHFEQLLKPENKEVPPLKVLAVLPLIRGIFIEKFDKGNMSVYKLIQKFESGTYLSTEEKSNKRLQGELQKMMRKLSVLEREKGSKQHLDPREVLQVIEAVQGGSPKKQAVVAALIREFTAAIESEDYSCLKSRVDHALREIGEKVEKIINFFPDREYSSIMNCLSNLEMNELIQNQINAKLMEIAEFKVEMSGGERKSITA